MSLIERVASKIAKVDGFDDWDKMEEKWRPTYRRFAEAAVNEIGKIMQEWAVESTLASDQP